MEMFKKKDDYKIVKSFGLSQAAIDKLEDMKKEAGVSRSQIIEELLLNYKYSYVYQHYFELAIEPKVKKRPRFGGSNTYTDEKTKIYETRVKTALRKWWTDKPLEGALKVDICFQFACPKTTKNGYPGKMDLDNLIKSWLDGANGIIWKDDRQIIKVDASKKFGIDDRIIFRFSPTDIDMTYLKETKSGYKRIES